MVSTTLQAVGPNATPVNQGVAEEIRHLEHHLEGEVDITGTVLAQDVTELGLIDEYRLYYHPVVLGEGTPFFAGPCPPLRLTARDRIGPSVIRLTYVPA